MKLSRFRTFLVYSATFILFVAVIGAKGSVSLLPVLPPETVTVEFRYDGASEIQVEKLVTVLEDAFAALPEVSGLFSLSEPGRGRIVVSFRESSNPGQAYIMISDETARCFSDFPDRVNRPQIMKGDSSSSPVYIAVYEGKEAGMIKRALEQIDGVGEVTVAGESVKELFVRIDPERLLNAALFPSDISKAIREYNFSGMISVPDGTQLLFSERPETEADFGRIPLNEKGMVLSDVAEISFREREEHSFGRINGKDSPIVYITENGDRNTVALCRDLNRVAGSLGCREIYSRGRDIEAGLIWAFSLVLLCQLAVVTWLRIKTGSNLAAFRSAFGLVYCTAGALAVISFAGFRIDAAVAASLCTVSVLSVKESRFLISFPLAAAALLFAALFYCSPGAGSLLLGPVSASLSFLLLSLLFPRPASGRILILLLMVPIQLFPVLKPEKEAGFSMEYKNGTSWEYIRKTAAVAERMLLEKGGFVDLAVYGEGERVSFSAGKGSLPETDETLFPDVFFYYPEKFSSRTTEVIIYGQSMDSLYENASALTDRLKALFPEAEIVLNYGSRIMSPVFIFPAECSVTGLFPRDISLLVSDIVSAPVIGKLFLHDGEHDIRMGGPRGRYPEEAASNPYAGSWIRMDRELHPPGIIHRNRIRSLSFMVRGADRSLLEKAIASFVFTGDCRGEICRHKEFLMP